MTPVKKPVPFRVEWQAHEYEHKERSSDWFWAVGIIAISLAIASIIFGNVIFGILVIVAAFALALFINREPETISVAINEQGIAKGRVFYPYSSLESFWIDGEHSHPKILLRSKKAFLPLIVVPLGNRDPEDTAELLSKNLAEEFHSLPLLEGIIEYLGF